MDNKIKIHSVGTLEIYIEPAHKVRHGERTLFRKIFPKSAWLHIISEAKKDGIIKASVHNTYSSYSNGGEIQTFNLEGDNSRLSMCVQLIDKKEKLEEFFLKHKVLLKSKVVIYKDVEIWDLD